MTALVFLRHVRNPRFSAVLAVAALLVTAPGWAASLDLRFEDALRLAVQRAPALAARQSQTEAAREEAARASALPDPKLTLGIKDLPVDTADAFNPGVDSFTMKTVGLKQEIPARAKRRARQTVADRSIDQAEALTAAEQVTVRQSVAQAWVTLWAAERELNALHSLREQSALAIRIAKAQLRSGVGTAVDAMATQAAALELENRIDASAASVDAARDSLARWLGTVPEDTAIGGDPPDLTVLPTSEARLLASVDQQGPLLPWQAREAVAAAEVDLATADKRPDWSIGVSYGQRDRYSELLSVEVGIGLPLFPRNRQDRGIAARRADLDAVIASHEDARRAQIEAIRRALAEWNGLKRQIARKEQEMLPLARDRAQTAVASYGGGGELQPWLEARRVEIELHVEHARHLGELGRVWAALAYLLPNEEVRP